MPATRHVAACFAALQLAGLEQDAGARLELREHVLTLELPQFAVTRHRLVRRSRCDVCAEPASYTALVTPVVLQPAPRSRDGTGGHRVCSAEETFARCAHLVSPITGVVASLGPSRDRDHPLRPVYGAAYFVCPAPDAAVSSDGFSRPALGKGRTPAQARASALAEALERHAAIWTGDEPHVRATASELGDAAVRPPALLDFSTRQYADRVNSGASAGDFRHAAPLHFCPDQILSWVPCWSLTFEQPRYVPGSYAFNHAPTPAGERVCPFNPNGTAAGNCREEAILQAFLELVERDAVAIWWYNRLCLPGIELSSFDDDYLLRVRAHYATLGWTLWALDLTHDLGIATVAALAMHEASGRFAAGFGCHLDPALALERAVTEVHQVFDPAGAHPPLWTLSELAFPDFVMPSRSSVARRRDEMSCQVTADLRDEVIHCVDRAKACGLEVLVLDYTRPDLVLSTVRVIVPGLRHFWRRLGPGRLYDVPVKLRLRAQALPETELNPLTLRL